MNDDVTNIKALRLIKRYVEILQPHICNADLLEAIQQLEKIENHLDYIQGLSATDRPDLLPDDFKEKYIWEINFWDNK